MTSGRMTEKKILRIGHPLLLETAAEVNEFNTSSLDTLLEDMFDTMDTKHGVGIAAPQIGISQRVIIFGMEDNQRYPDMGSIPTTILINPEMEPLDNHMDFYWEGCLSVPGMRGLVPRYRQILYRGYPVVPFQG